MLKVIKQVNNETHTILLTTFVSLQGNCFRFILSICV